MPDDVFFKRLPFTDRRLGRHVFHDTRSRGFAASSPVDTSTWRTRTLRVYDPTPNPDQPNGCCTFVSKCVQFNTVGNRIAGRILRMDTAQAGYSLATRLDPFAGEFPPEDTGSNGLAASRAAQEMGLGLEYRWRFDGADGVVQEIVNGNAVSIGTRWDNRMFDRDSKGFVHLGGGVAGGHQWTGIGYSESLDAIKGRCWWGDFRDFYIKRTDLAELLADDGDAHVQRRA